MIHTVRGIILRRRDITESSLIIVSFTDRAGKLSLLAKGARRAKSPFLGRVELFTLCNFTYYENERRGLNILSECDIIDPFAALRSDLAGFTTACFITGLVDWSTFPSSRAHRIFELLKTTLASIASFPDRRLLRIYFLLHFLSLSGYSLQLGACVSCRRRAADLRYFSAKGGGMLCAGCGKKAAQPLGVGAGTVATLRYLMENDISGAERIRLDASQAEESESILKRAMIYHLDPPPRIIADVLGNTLCGK